MSYLIVRRTTHAEPTSHTEYQTAANASPVVTDVIERALLGNH